MDPPPPPPQQQPQQEKPIRKGDIVKLLISTCIKRGCTVKEYKTRAEVDALNARLKESNRLIRLRNHRKLYAELYPAIDYLMKLGKGLEEAEKLARSEGADEDMENYLDRLEIAMLENDIPFEPRRDHDSLEEEEEEKAKKMANACLPKPASNNKVHAPVGPREPEHKMEEYAPEFTPDQWWVASIPLLGWSETAIGVDMPRVLDPSAIYDEVTVWYKEDGDSFRYTASRPEPMTTQAIFSKFARYKAYIEEVERPAIGHSMRLMNERIIELEKIVFLANHLVMQGVPPKDAAKGANEDEAPPPGGLFMADSDPLQMMRKTIALFEGRIRQLEAHKSRGDQLYKMFETQAKGPSPSAPKQQQPTTTTAPPPPPTTTKTKKPESKRRPPRRNPMPKHVAERMAAEEEEENENMNVDSQSQD